MSKEVSIFDKYESKTEHNLLIGTMVHLISIGIANINYNMSASDLLYINHLLERMRK